MIKLGIVILILSMNLLADMKDAYNKTTDAQKIAWMYKGMELIKDKLKDSKSANFKDVYFHNNQVPMTCGWVNSKNSFGGYSGYKKFISAGKIEFTFIEEEVIDFENLWNQFCK